MRELNQLGCSSVPSGAILAAGRSSVHKTDSGAFTDNIAFFALAGGCLFLLAVAIIAQTLLKRSNYRESPNIFTPCRHFQAHLGAQHSVACVVKGERAPPHTYLYLTGFLAAAIGAIVCLATTINLNTIALGGARLVMKIRMLYGDASMMDEVTGSKVVKYFVGTATAMIIWGIYGLCGMPSDNNV